MPERVHGIRVSLKTKAWEKDLKRAVARHLSMTLENILHISVQKRSLDARRKKQEPSWVFTAEVWTAGEEEALKEALREQEERSKPETPTFRVKTSTRNRARPIVVGLGPAGLFAALALVDSGVPCLVLERGAPLADRHRDVRAFRRQGALNPKSNLCFGEGGAGTYSDGKLYTRKKHHLVRPVYERLVAFGATEKILTDAHPHIGTNKLYGILEQMREHLLEREAEIRFHTCVDELVVEEGVVEGVKLDTGEVLPGSPVILASGHSARDLYETLHAQGVEMTPKPFAIGARCEHPQALIDERQLGAIRDMPDVEPAEYFLSCQLGNRGLYSFCMCPGGFIIPTPTEIGHLNVNGMSNSNRGGDFANAALVVTVEPSDFFIEQPGDLEQHGVLAGLEFQRHWEKRAFEAGGNNYHAPAQRLTDLVRGKSSSTLPSRTSYRPGLVGGDMADVLPHSVVSILKEGIPKLDRKLHGYLMEEAILVGVETTTSTPVRMVRDAGRQSLGVDGLYPTGEGAGYSGGIVSSAIEGILSAEAVLNRYYN